MYKGCPHEIEMTKGYARVVNCGLERTMKIENSLDFEKGFFQISYNASAVSKTRKRMLKSTRRRAARGPKLGSLGQLSPPCERDIEHGSWFCSLY